MSQRLSWRFLNPSLSKVMQNQTEQGDDMAEASYYEQLAKNIRSELYPQGVRIAYWQKINREVNKADARKRKQLAKKMGVR